MPSIAGALVKQGHGCSGRGHGRGRHGGGRGGGRISGARGAPAAANSGKLAKPSKSEHNKQVIDGHLWKCSFNQSQWCDQGPAPGAAGQPLWLNLQRHQRRPMLLSRLSLLQCQAPLPAPSKAQVSPEPLPRQLASELCTQLQWLKQLLPLLSLQSRFARWVVWDDC